MAMIEAIGLGKRFGTLQAVAGVSFAVDRGEVVGFLGPNGAGKSTTMKMIAGFLPPTTGTARVGGHDVRRDPIAVKARLGYLPEGAPAYGDMRVGAFLDFVAALRGLDGKDRSRRIGEVVEQMQLGHVLDQRIETLSKGYKRRVGIAQALVHDPEALILDEPTDGLDPNQKHEVRELIRSMAARKAIIVSTHILEEVEAVCTRAIIIARGRVLADETPAALLARASRRPTVAITVRADAHEQALALLGAIPGVEQVEVAGRVNGVANLRVVPAEGPANGNEILGAVGAALVRDGVALEDLHVERPRLDEVFRQITAG
ncbi:ABC transporter ATP-binding protein [Arenibaculum pallidiluteum]|uniref:ABC transporter ATP-binding protein n=1 Tax=Arenibaculum pallidiluteum TaxID=2812559 RepID=UPI001A95E2CA|nr:ABC transporter ATP-binding protein [Arenibaculum pallidiluteum]